MAEAIAERVRRYILDGSDEDLRRLLSIAETTPGDGHSAFRRVGPAVARGLRWEMLRGRPVSHEQRKGMGR